MSSRRHAGLRAESAVTTRAPTWTAPAALYTRTGEDVLTLAFPGALMACGPGLVVLSLTVVLQVQHVLLRTLLSGCCVSIAFLKRRFLFHFCFKTRAVPASMGRRNCKPG